MSDSIKVRICWTLMIAFSCAFWYVAFQGFEYTIDLVFEFINN